MTTAKATIDHSKDSMTPLGFWLYLMTDCLLFASLFATYAVLRNNTAGGVSGAEIFDMPYILVETLLLLTSSLTSGITLIMMRRGQMRQALWWLLATIGLGAGFLGMELYEFGVLLAEGHSWQSSAFLSAFFTLVGTHGAHIAVGLIWASVLAVLLLRRGISDALTKKFTMFTMFWHFLDVIWICVFTFVYALGAIS